MSEGLAIHVDWFQGICHFTSFESLLSFIEFLNSSSDSWVVMSDQPFWSGRRFDNKISSVWGGQGGFNRGINSFELLLVLPGQYLSCSSEDWLVSLFSYLQGLNFQVTRLDIALDDFLKRVTLDLVLEAAVNNCGVGFESYRNFDGNGVNTIYFGSPDSDKQLRFYDADFVHGIGSDRWELQLRRDYAHTVFYGLDLSCLSRSLSDYLFSLVRFVDRSSAHRVSDCKLLDWWASLSEGSDKIKFALPKYPFSLAKLQRWLSRQVIPSLSVLRFGLGKEKFQDYLESECHNALFEDRLSYKHLAFIDFLSNNSEVV